MVQGSYGVTRSVKRIREHINVVASSRMNINISV